MLQTIPARQGCYPLSPVWRELHPRPPRMCDFGAWDPGTGRGQGDAGLGGLCKAGNRASNSLHMLPVLPRRLGTHRSAWISQEHGLTPVYTSAAQVWFELGAGGWGPK